MPSCSATWRASYTSSSEQQRPALGASGMPCRPGSRVWSQSCNVSPTTVPPAWTRIAATVEESTPPDMATAMVVFCMTKYNYSLLAFSSQHLSSRLKLFTISFDFGGWSYRAAGINFHSRPNYIPGVASRQVMANRFSDRRSRGHRRNRPQVCNGFGNCAQHVIYIRFHRSFQQTEAQTGARAVLVQAHRHEHVA